MATPGELQNPSETDPLDADRKEAKQILEELNIPGRCQEFSHFMKLIKDTWKAGNDPNDYIKELQRIILKFRQEVIDTNTKLTGILSKNTTAASIVPPMITAYSTAYPKETGSPLNFEENDTRILSKKVERQVTEVQKLLAQAQNILPTIENLKLSLNTNPAFQKELKRFKHDNSDDPQQTLQTLEARLDEMIATAEAWEHGWRSYFKGILEWGHGYTKQAATEAKTQVSKAMIKVKEEAKKFTPQN